MHKLGTLDPIIYFENAKGEIVLPPTSADARHWYESSQGGPSYRERGFELRGAETLAEVDALQARLVAQDRATNERALAQDDAQRRQAWYAIAERLRARMCSSSTSPYEREFIELYLKLREEKRDKHRQRFLERISYLWAREMDSGSKATDRVRGL
jgi:hypothetical protein